MSDKIIDLLGNFPELLLLLGFGLTASLLASIIVKNLASGIKLSLRVAVIGLPRAGKTSLITVVFDSIMSGKIAKYASVQGTETAERLATYQSMMIDGIGLSPTTDNDVFAYRYLVDRKFLGILSIRHDVEIADFPGEYSGELSADMNEQTFSNRLFGKEFFSWIVRADKYIFVIDTEAYLAHKMAGDPEGLSKFILDTEVAFKNAVLQFKQQLLDEKVYNRPVLVVFTKCDLFVLKNAEDKIYKSEITYLDPIFQEIIDSEAVVERLHDDLSEMRSDFDRLFKFLNNNFNSVKHVMHSSYCDAGIFRDINKVIVQFSSPK